MAEDRPQQAISHQPGDPSGSPAGKSAPGRPQIRNPKSEIENPAAAVAPFIEQIQKDAQAEIENIRGRAALTAKRKLEEAQREAESSRRQATQSAEDQARRIEARTLSGVSLETRRTMLRVEGDIVTEVVERARESVKALRDRPEYADFLKGLAVEGILALGEEHCLLAPAGADAKLFTPQRVADIKETAERLTGRQIKLTLSNDPSVEGFGVRVYSGSRRTLFDNTLAARLQRLADELRMIVVKTVLDRPLPESSRGHGSGARDQEHR